MGFRFRLLTLILTLIVLPVAYIAAINASVPHDHLAFSAGWTDPMFAGWTVNSSAGASAFISVSNGVLSVVSTTSVTPQQFVAADSPNLSQVDRARYPFLLIAIRAPAYFVAARIGIATEQRGLVLVLVKTFPDSGWHTEVIDLRFFGLADGKGLLVIELGWLGVERTAPANTRVEFQDVMLASLVGGRT
jgi:hypothetical protein